MDLETLIYLAGIFHVPLLLAGSLVPRVFQWKKHLAAVPIQLASLFRLYYLSLGIILIGFGGLSLFFPEFLASGIGASRFICGILAVFWGHRLIVQLFGLDGKEFLKTNLERFGFHGLTLVFAFLSVVYGWSALNVG